MPADVLYIVTDQGPSTGIGVYADGLAKLLRGTFPDVKVLSLCYFPVEPRPDWVRLPDFRVAHSALSVPGVMRHNYRLMKRMLPADSRVHFCGASYGLVSHYPNSVVTIHDYYPRQPSISSLGNPRVVARDLSSLWHFITLPRQVRTARARVVPSRYVQKCLARGSSLSSVAISHWVDSARFRPRDKRVAREELSLPLDERLVLNVSVGASNKNYAALADVAAHLGKNDRMVKVGGKLPDGLRVSYLPWVSHDRYPLLFNACDAYVHTSRHEGFGWPLIESMASELPVVSLRTEVALEVLGDAGTYVGGGAPAEEWVAAIDRVTKQKSHDEMVTSERRRLSQFDPAVAREAYTQVYRDAFGK
jgi:glycosyltransferase involved in cell wall biosynthesis